MKTALSIMICILLCGCSFFREQAKTGCEELTLNTQAARELAVCILDSHLVWSGVARGAMLSDMDKLPVEVVKAWDELDLLAIKHAEGGELTDIETGRVLGYKIRLLREAVREIITRVAPKALEYLL